jgi:hypothetical protein
MCVVPAAPPCALGNKQALEKGKEISFEKNRATKLKNWKRISKATW